MRSPWRQSRVFDSRGNRENRGKARLRRVRERDGDTQFHALLDKELRAVKNETRPPAVTLICHELNLLHALDLNPVCGVITPEQTEAIADLAHSGGHRGSDDRTTTGLCRVCAQR